MPRRGRLSQEDIGKIMAKVCPADAHQDAEMKRLLAELDRHCKPDKPS